MVKKSLYCLMVILVSLLIFFGCNQNMFNAVLYDDAINWIRDDFINNNRTGGSYYGDNLEFVTDDSLPDQHSFVVSSDEEADKIFNDNFDLTVDYNSEMIIVYTFTTIYHRQCELTDIEQSKNVLNISYKMKKVGSNSGDASMPYQRWFIIKMNLLDVLSVQIERQN